MGLLLVLVLGVAAAGAATRAEDAARRAPPLCFNPGPEYADGVRMFQGIPGIERAANGRLWATWYGGGTGEDRHNYIMLVTSGDKGKTWSKLKLVIDERNGVSYPDAVESPQGIIYLIYDFHRTSDKQILMAVFTEADVLAGRWASSVARQRVVVNQATGTRPPARTGSSAPPRATAAFASLAKPVRAVAGGNRIVARDDDEVNPRFLPPKILGRRFWNLLPAHQAKPTEKHILKEPMLRDAARSYSLSD
jgi:hypothetical protein